MDIGIRVLDRLNGGRRRATSTVCGLFLTGCLLAAGPAPRAGSARPITADRLAMVDCLLPAQIIQLGGMMTTLGPRVPEKSTASECEIRGGEYVAFDRANYATALQVWLPKAKDGDPQAQTYVGEIFEKGMGIPSDYAKAAEWYRKAADQGYVKAQSDLAYLYEQGLGVPKDPLQAINLYRQSSGITDNDLTFVSEVKAVRTELQGQIDALSAQLEEQTTDADALRRQVEESRGQITDQAERLAAARRESEHLRQRVAALQSDPTAGSPQKLAELAQAKTELKSRQERIAGQEAELAALKATSTGAESRLTAQLAAAAADAAKLRQQLGERTSIAETAQAQLTAATARLAALDRQVSQLQTETKDARERLKAAATPAAPVAPAAPSGAQVAELAALHQKAAEGEQAIAALQATRKQYETQVVDFNRATAEAAKLRQQLSEKSSSAAAAQTQLAAANARLAALDAQVSTLQAETKDAQAQLKAARSAGPSSAEAAQLAALRQKAADGEQAIVALQATRKQYETQVADFTRATAEAAKLRQRLDQQLSEKTASAAAAQTQLTAANAKLAALDAQVLKLQAETRDAQVQLKAVKSAGPSSAEVAELAGLRQKAAAGEQAILALQATRKQYEAQIADFTRAAAANHEQLQGSRAQIASLQQRALDSEQRLSQANQRLLEQEQQLIADRGRLAAAQAGTQQMRTLETTLAEREAKLGEQRSIIAGLQAEADSYRTEIGRLKSSPSVVQVASVTVPATRSARVQVPPEILGTYHALIIGNDSYNFMPNLTTAVSDADAVAKVLRTKYGFETHVLHNATNDEIMTAVNDYRKTLRSDDNLLIYYAGHGELDEKNYRGYWLPVNAKRDDMTAWISDQMITGQLNAMVARHVLVVADSCYAGAMTRSGGVQLVSKGGDDAEAKRLRYLAGRQSRTVLTSGGAAPVVDVGPGGHSIFARAFVDALEKNSQILEGAELYNDIFDVVRGAAKRLFQFDQSPRYEKIRDAGHQNGEFLFVPRST